MDASDAVTLRRLLLDFGMYLLQDENGIVVDFLRRDNIHDGAESVTQAILQKWLTSDTPTHTYQHLIECLRESELGSPAVSFLTVILLHNTYQELLHLHIA